jgi:bifunctional aspartokinase / homoserine dehydrogenase 1
MPREVEVYKFGGTSVRDAGRIQRVVALVRAEDDRLRRVVVTSALGGVTDRLLAAIDEALARTGGHRAVVAELRARHEEALAALVPAAEQDALRAELDTYFGVLTELLDGAGLLGECTPRAKDAIAGMGERLAAPLVAAAFRQAGVEAVAVDAGPLVLTDDHFGEAAVDFGETDRRIQAHFAEIPEDTIPVVTGFVGATARGVTTTLGRSGSDYTATIFAAALGARRCVIWTDVDGVLSADPRLVPEAAPLPTLHYREAAELAYFGAKVLHPRTMRPLTERGIPLLIKNTLNPDAPGTLITDTPGEAHGPVRGVTTVRGVTLLTLEGTSFAGEIGVMARALGALANAGADVIMTSQASSEESVSFVVRAPDADVAEAGLKAAFAGVIGQGEAQIVRRTGCAIVTAVGDEMRGTSGIAGRLFEALGFERIEVVMIAQSAAQNSISAVVDDAQAARALRAIHETFDRDREVVRLAVVGATGGVGRALVRMIEEGADRLADRADLRLRLVALASSSRMVFDPKGLSADVIAHLEEGEPTDLALLADRLAEMPQRRVVFVDCTASEAAADVYPRLLEEGVAVVTPNKRANTREMAYYRRLAALGTETPFLYETTVGAALPVLATLRDLVRSGDRVRRIEGVLSGTLAFVFSEMRAGVPFSEAVREARRRGFTEPDPRDDLEGRDVARKLLTLAREAGFEAEMDEVAVASLVPAHLHEVPLAEFLTRLDEADATWAQRLAALPEGHRIAYVGAVEPDEETGRVRLSVGVREVAPGHPLSILEGTDSLVAFTTDRYERPLVVFGPGAGPDITAAGTLADVVHAALRMGERL